MVLHICCETSKGRNSERRLQTARPVAVMHTWKFNPQDLVDTVWALALLAVEESATRKTW